MDFPLAPDIVYPRNTLMSVLCDIRFPKILKINHSQPHELQDILRGKGYAEFSSTVSLSPDFSNAVPFSPEMFSANMTQVNTFHFFSREHGWRVSLSSEQIALTCSRSYQDHVEFKERLTEILRTFSGIYQPSEFRRIGLRYQNIVNSTSLPSLESVALHEVIPPKIFPELVAPFSSSIKGIEKIMQLERDDLKAQVIYFYGEMAGVFEGKNFNELSYGIDIDCFIEQKLEVNNVLSHYDSLRNKVRDIFDYSISPVIRNGLQSSA
jgi:uncharacterized protein (TIGR04255 family)